MKKILKFINKFNLKITHIHPNNWGGVDKFGNPIVIEVTFEKYFIKNKIKNKLPNKLDMKNNTNLKDIKLKFS
mgnify:CR=1 FL=1